MAATNSQAGVARRAGDGALKAGLIALGVAVVAFVLGLVLGAADAPRTLTGVLLIAAFAAVPVAVIAFVIGGVQRLSAR